MLFTLKKYLYKLNYCILAIIQELNISQRKYLFKKLKFVIAFEWKRVSIYMHIW